MTTSPPPDSSTSAEERRTRKRQQREAQNLAAQAPRRDPRGRPRRSTAVAWSAISVRVTPAEKTRWTALAHQQRRPDGRTLTLSDWVRQRCERPCSASSACLIPPRASSGTSGPPSVDTIIWSPSIVRQAAQFGNNLNQIAYAINLLAQRKVLHEHERVVLMEALRQVTALRPAFEDVAKALQLSRLLREHERLCMAIERLERPGLIQQVRSWLQRSPQGDAS